MNLLETQIRYLNEKLDKAQAYMDGDARKMQAVLRTLEGLCGIEPWIKDVKVRNLFTEKVYECIQLLKGEKDD